MTHYIAEMIETYFVEGKFDLAAELKAAEKAADAELAKKGARKKNAGDDDSEFGSTPASAIKAAALRGSRRTAGYKAEPIVTGRKITGRGAYGTGGSHSFSDIDKDDDHEEKKPTTAKKYSDLISKATGMTAKAHSGASKVHKIGDEEGSAKPAASGHPPYITSAQAKLDAAKTTGEKEKATKDLKSFQKIHSTFQKGGMQALKDMHTANSGNKNVQARIQAAMAHHSTNESVNEEIELDEMTALVTKKVGERFSTKVRTSKGETHDIESEEHPTAMGLPKFKAHAERILRHKAMGLA